MREKVRQGWLAALLVSVLFVALAALPVAIQSRSATPWISSAKRLSPVALPAAPSALTSPDLVAAAQPTDPGGPPATQPAVDSVRMAALVAGEDLRLRTLLHHIGRLTYPEVVPGSGRFDVSSGVMTGGTSTLVLPGPASYTIADLQGAGALIPLAQGGYLLIDSVLVGAGATLTLGGDGLPTLLLDSSASGFTSLVTWGGTLALSGASAAAPLTIMSWDRTANAPATSSSYGRPYIRAVGGRLDLKDVRVSHLGFWSGRTGGVAWTGISSQATTGSATGSAFEQNAYGAFVSRANNVQFSDDLFQQNELDGLRFHRGTSSSSVVGSSAARNGGNGFVISRGATGNVLRGDLAVNNGGNGFFVNGQSLVNGAGPSGGETIASAGTVLDHNEAESNARTAILIEGGSGTVVQDNIVCSTQTGIAVRQGATGTYLVGNQVRCGPRVAISIGPGVVGTTLDADVVDSGRIGILIRNSPGVRLMNNTLTRLTVFGLSIHGSSPGVVGTNNVIAGTGFRPIDVRSGASNPLLTSSNLAGWQHQSTITFLGYLRYHPLITTWLVILLFVMVSTVAVRFRRRPLRPYTHAVRWNHSARHHGATALAAVSPMTDEAIVRRAPATFAAAAPAVKSRPAALSGPVNQTPNGSDRAEHASRTAASALLYRPFARHAREAGGGPQAGGSAESPPDGTGRHPGRSARSPVASVASPEHSVEPGEAAPQAQFWKWLADGNWAGDEGRLQRNTEQEAPA